MHYETDNLPADVEEIFFSGKFWYAASKAKIQVMNKPVAVGVGTTRDEAIADMRDLESRYLPVKDRGPTWRDKQERYAAPRMQ